MMFSTPLFSSSLTQKQTHCLVCPRNCGTDRYNKKFGYCNTSQDFEIASVCIHQGEEPVISGSSGICNIFFRGCNMQCIYCQNSQISINRQYSDSQPYTPDRVIGEICRYLDRGCKAVGFVSPSHMVPQMIEIIRSLKEKGRHPVFVYNTNAYDKVEVLRQLEGIIDIYLPDLKYSDDKLALELSHTPDYVDVAQRAIREMFRQKGTPLHLDDHGQAISGLIIRHLVLPGYTENSKNVLRFIAEEISSRVHVSLMSQYHPMTGVSDHPDLGRCLRPKEYDEIVAEMELLSFTNGWIQALESSTVYLPDFNMNHPFEYEVNQIMLLS